MVTTAQGLSSPLDLIFSPDKHLLKYFIFLQDKKSVIGLQESVEAFKAVVLQNNPNIEGTSKYKVVGNAGKQ